MNAPADPFFDQLPELALGALSGPERAAVLDHVRGCASCQAELADLVDTVDRLTALPSAEPAPGFESRVLARFDAEADTEAEAEAEAEADAAAVAPVLPLGPRPRSLPRIAAVAAAVVALVALGAVVGSQAADRNPPRSSTQRDVPADQRTSPMLTPAGKEVGHATISGTPAAVMLVAPGWTHSGADTYRMRVMTSGGQVHDRTPVELDEGYGAYPVVGVPAADVRRIELIAADGSVACSADFT